jgi:Uncharacterized protein conserved in bacteria
MKLPNKTDYRISLLERPLRDIIFEHAYKIKAPRATKDIDLAVQVSTWTDFEQLKKGLAATGHFAYTKMAQRLLQ